MEKLGSAIIAGIISTVIGGIILWQIQKDTGPDDTKTAVGSPGSAFTQSNSPAEENSATKTNNDIPRQEVSGNRVPNTNEAIEKNNDIPLTTPGQQPQNKSIVFPHNSDNAANEVNPSSDPIVINPVSAEDKCKRNNTGEYSFTNRTSKTLSVRLYRKNDIYRRNPIRELIINAGQSNTFRDLQVDSYVCFIEENAYRSDHGIPGNLPYGYQVFTTQTDIVVIQCENPTFEIR